jgi:hypothetical protein
MIRFRALGCAFLALGLAAISSPASAITMVVKYTGTVTDSTYIGGDHFGLSPGGSIEGAAVAVRVRYDTALGERTTVAGVTDQLFGGGIDGTVSPILSYRITINGYSEEMSDPFYGFAMAQPSELSQTASSYGGTRHVTISALSYGGAAFEPDLEASLPVTSLTGPLQGFGFFGIVDCWRPDCTPDDDFLIADMSFDTIGVAPVPLPASLGIIVAALSALGLVGWRRRGDRLV